jgi:ABC-type sugar transport system permease subunit
MNAEVLPIFMYRTAFRTTTAMRFAYGSAISNIVVFISMTSSC